MTATGQEPKAATVAGQPVARDDQPPGGDLVRDVCRYLIADDGGWRSSQPTRDHRCGATQPPSPLAVAKQRELCLTPGHRACATYGAARDLEHRPRGMRARDDDDGFWPATRGTVLALEPARSRIGMLAASPGRTGGQAMLVALMVLAFLVLVIARTSPSSTAGGPGASSPAAAASDSPNAQPSGPASPAPSASATPLPTSSPTSPSATPPIVSPSPTAAPSIRPGASSPPGATRYRVKPGDTLSSIAGRFNVTVKKLRVANGLSDNVIRVGQVLVIP